VSGGEAQKLVSELYATPAPVVEKASEMLN
jgi:hypothetical protein